MADPNPHTGPSLQSLQAEIDALKAQIAPHGAVKANWDALADAERSAQVREAYAALLDDANSWAQHYSTVRMTVTTFLVTVALGVIQFQWESPGWPAVIAAGLCWLVAVVLFAVFTSLEFRKLNESIRNKLIFRALAGQVDEKKQPLKWGAAAQPKRLSVWSDGAAWILGVLTVLFLAVLVFEWNPVVKGGNDDAACPRGCVESGGDSR